MLILSREAGETIVITAPDGTKIVVMAVEIRRKKMRIGVEAPRTYSVHRAEVQEQINSATTAHT